MAIFLQASIPRFRRIPLASLALLMTPILFAEAATKSSQMQVSLTVIVTCRVEKSNDKPIVLCFRDSPTRVSEGMPFALIQSSDGNETTENSHIVEIAF